MLTRCVFAGQEDQPVVPSAPPASVIIDQQPYQLDPYPPKPVSADPNTTTTTCVTATDTDTDTVRYLSIVKTVKPLNNVHFGTVKF